MSNKSHIARTAAAITDMEAAMEVTRQEHPRASTTHIEAKVAAFAEVVRNTRRKMHTPAGFDWAMHRSFKVVSIDRGSLHVEASPGAGRPNVILTIPRSDLSLSTWEVTGIIRRLTVERRTGELNLTVAGATDLVATKRKEVTDAQDRLRRSEDLLAEAQVAVARYTERLRAIEVKRDVNRARRGATAPMVAAAS